MPLKRTYTKPKPKTLNKGYKRRYRKRMPLKVNVNAGLGFPRRMVVRQKYNENFVLTGTTGALANHVFGLNCLYDPNITGVGHQPMYFDQYMGIYNHYTVIGCKMIVKATAYESNLAPALVCLWQNDDSTITPTGIQSFSEQSKAKCITLGDGGNASKTLSLNWSAKKTFGPPLANTLLRGNSTNNPTEQSCGVVSIQAIDSASTVNVGLQIFMEFIVVYTELRDIAGS